MDQKLYKYKIIFFDWSNTLSKSLFWEQLEKPEHPRHSWFRLINKFLFIENKQLIKDWMIGKVCYRSICDKITDYLVKNMKRQGINSNDYFKEEIRNLVEDDLKKSCREMRFVSNEILGLLKKLKRTKKKCVIATDNMDTFIKFTKPSMKLEKYFDDFLVSSELKTLKFNYKDGFKGSLPFFDQYIKKQRVSYKEVILIDDCSDSTGGFKKLGFKTLRIENAEHLVNVLKNGL